MSTASRVIASVRGGAPGPTLIVVGGVHGNEPAGIAAARAVLGKLSSGEVRGEVLALMGNLRAGAITKRYIAEDLNRMWKPARLSAARALAVDERTAEVAELVELADAIDGAIARATGTVFVLDLHTTSAAGVPFAVVGPT